MSMGQSVVKSGHGPFRADQLKDGDRYELSDGHPIYCAPAGSEHARRSLTGAAVIASDPDVEWAGVDAGFAPQPGVLRAPDVAVAAPAKGPGWIEGVPRLAVEYASVGQDESDLKTKIRELLAGGCELIWVARLKGPRRVEVYRPGEPMRIFASGEQLAAPGILHNPVEVDALFEQAAADRAVLRNLLQRAGYAGLDAVREEGRDEGLETGRGEGIAESILTLLDERAVVVPSEVEARVRGCRDPEALKTWLRRAARVEDALRLFD
jgi:Uma2 family endonuclease